MLVLSFTDLERDPRVHRQIEFLCEDHEVVAAGLVDPRVAGVSFVPLPRYRQARKHRVLSALVLLAGGYERYYWSRLDVAECRRRLTRIEVDVIVANDIQALPVALDLAGRAGVLFDAHEYAPGEYEDLWWFRLFLRDYRRYLCRTYIPRAHGMTTVCDMIADAYERDTGVRPMVVWNAAHYHELSPAAGGDSDGKVRLVHHGAALPSRKLERMIRAMDDLDSRFELHFLLVPTDPRCLDRLRREASADPRICFHEPVPMHALPRYLNQFDVGICFFPPVSFNLHAALPNKLFEFVQARLALVVGPSPEMARLVRDYDLGLVTRDFSPASLASSLHELDGSRIAHFKRRAHAAARPLSSEATRMRFREQVAALLARQSPS